MKAEQLARDGAVLLGEDLAGWRAVAGGDLSLVVRARLASGGEVVFKTGPSPGTEAGMLRAVRAAGVPAPVVLAASDTVLALAVLADDGGLSAQGWADLGTAVRRLHGTIGNGYGWPCDYAFGTVPIRNAPVPDWPEFWAERRLLSVAGGLPVDHARRLDSLASDLGNRLPARPPAALLHGDLWAGNVLAAGGRLSGLIDPACYHGHAEVDLAMLRLFGGPGREFETAYGPLEPGADERLAIYQIWPAIVHVRLFGGGYLGLLDRLLSRVGV